MKNVSMKKIGTAVAVILISAILMLIPQLIHTGFQLAAVNWQSLAASSLLIDVCVYFGFLQASEKRVEAK